MAKQSELEGIFQSRVGLATPPELTSAEEAAFLRDHLARVAQSSDFEGGLLGADTSDSTSELAKRSPRRRARARPVLAFCTPFVGARVLSTSGREVDELQWPGVAGSDSAFSYSTADGTLFVGAMAGWPFDPDRPGPNQSSQVALFTRGWTFSPRPGARMLAVADVEAWLTGTVPAAAQSNSGSIDQAVGSLSMTLYAGAGANQSNLKLFAWALSGNGDAATVGYLPAVQLATPAAILGPNDNYAYVVLSAHVAANHVQSPNDPSTAYATMDFSAGLTPPRLQVSTPGLLQVKGLYLQLCESLPRPNLVQ